MKHLFSIRFLILTVLLIGSLQTALGGNGITTVDGVKYIVYFTGEKYDAIADSAYVYYNSGVSGDVNIASSATYEYKWSEIVGYDSSGKPIYETIARYLTAPVIGIIDSNGSESNPQWAFKNCTNLLSVSIPNTVKHIGDKAFYGCSSLTTVILGNSVTTIGSYAFNYCGSLIDINLPNSVEVIGSHAFSCCYSLVDINIPNSVKVIGSSAFLQCSALEGALIIPNSVTEIGSRAFQDCSSLSSLVLGNSVRTIGSLAFLFCTGFSGTLTIPNSVVSIESGAFKGCSGLSGALIIPNSVTFIGGEAFNGCAGITSVILPNSITTIESFIFRDCTNLENVVIPNSVKTIESYAFKGCSNLLSIDIPNSVISIGYEAFSGCSSVGRIRIGYSVTSIGSGAFNGSSLTELIWDAKNCSSNEGMGTSHIETVSIGPSVEVLPKSFLYGSKITEITIPNSVTTIGDYAFYNCSNVANITCLATTPPLAQSNSFSNYSVTLNVPISSLEAYQTTAPWSNFTNIVGINEPGDVNGDGGINISDVTSLIDLLLSGGETSAGADVNGDGQVNISDVTALIDRLLSGN